VTDTRPADAPSRPQQASAVRWNWTRQLGQYGAVVLGASIELDLGDSWNLGLHAWQFGLPLASSDALCPSAEGGPAVASSCVRLALGTNSLGSWTTLGIVIGFVRGRRRPAAPQSLPPTEASRRYLTAAQADVEAILRGEDRKPDKGPRRGMLEFRRFSRVLANDGWRPIAATARQAGGHRTTKH
jgi:hypothetical protein